MWVKEQLVKILKWLIDDPTDSNYIQSKLDNTKPTRKKRTKRNSNGSSSKTRKNNI